MDIYGIDFTSRPSTKKPITCQHCHLDGNDLNMLSLNSWTGIREFEEALVRPGPWIAGIDFPFGLPRKFLRDVNWGATWQEYALCAKKLGKERYEAKIREFSSTKTKGQKQPRRQTDVSARALSPLKLDFVPIGKMFFQGAPRLVASGVAVPGLQEGDRKRTVVEAYPGALVRSAMGRNVKYKNDNPKIRTLRDRDNRRHILETLTSGSLKETYGIIVVADATQSDKLVEDPTGDSLDALLCAAQAAWAWLNRASLFENQGIDSIEGWIADPVAVPDAG